MRQTGAFSLRFRRNRVSFVERATIWLTSASDVGVCLLVPRLDASDRGTLMPCTLETRVHWHIDVSVEAMPTANFARFPRPVAIPLDNLRLWRQTVGLSLRMATTLQGIKVANAPCRSFEMF